MEGNLQITLQTTLLTHKTLYKANLQGVNF